MRYGVNLASSTPDLCGDWSISGNKVTFTGADGLGGNHVARWPTKTPTTGRVYFEIEVSHSTSNALVLYAGVTSPDLIDLCGSWIINYHAAAYFSGSSLTFAYVHAYGSSSTGSFPARTLLTRVGVAMDFDTNSIWISVNGTWLWADISDANGLFSSNRWGLNDYAPFVSRSASTGLLTAELFVDDADFVYKPSGFTAWGLV